MKIIEKAFYELIKTFAGGRVYVMVAKQNSAAPFVVFQPTDSARWRSVNGPSGMAQTYMQVDVYAESYYAAAEVAKAIEQTLDGYRGIVYYADQQVRIAGISLQNDLAIVDQTDKPILFRHSATYLVTHEQ